jgi:molybdopterin-guanine dinucleotide biosynthesis protein A
VDAGTTLLILAGGASRRMGREKGMLPVGQQTLVERLAERLQREVDETLVAVADESPRWQGLRQVVDRTPGLGPLAGMQASFRAAAYATVWVVACDLPDVLPGVGAYLRSLLPGFDAVVPSIGGKCQPLCAIYRASTVEVIEQLLGEGQRSVMSLLERIAIREVFEDELRAIDPELRSFRNLNTPDDYVAWLKTVS